MSKENLKPLKTLVFSMGLLLLGGTVLLMALVWKKVSSEAANGPSSHISGECKGGEIDLKGHGNIVDYTMDGKVMRLTLEKTNGTMEMSMVDICSGKITGTLLIHSDADLTAE